MMTYGIDSSSCECKILSIEEASESYDNIFLGEVKFLDSVFYVTVIQSWKGDVGTDSAFHLDIGDHLCDLYSIPDIGTHVFFTNSDQNKFCNTTESFYYFNDLEFLNQKFITTLVRSSKKAELLEKLEYERENVIKVANAEYDIKDKKVIFIQRYRFLNWFTRFNIEILDDIDRYAGFYTTRFHLVQEGYSSEYCQYDYVFWVTFTHVRYKVTQQVKRRVVRKIKRACT